MQRTQTLLAALFLGIVFATHSGATVYQSDGSDVNVQAIHDTNAHDGDTITLPAGTFIWTAGVSLTKGITVRGQTTITGAGTATCTADDQTIIIDEKPRKTPMRERNFQRKQEFRAPRDVTVKTPTTPPTSTTPATARERNSSVNRNRNWAVNRGSLLKATIPAGKSFRLTGITFKNSPNLTSTGGDGAIRVGSTGGLVTNARIDHCHFYHLAWGAMLQVSGWTYGVDDHNLFEQGKGVNHSHFITNGSTNGHTNGNGAWADFPYYGSDKFWFMEDNTIKGNGGSNTSGGVDCLHGGRYVARHNYWQNATPNGHGTEGWAVRGMRAYQIYNNTFFWAIPFGASQRSGSSIWHDNTWLGANSPNNKHTSLSYYREYAAADNKLTGWGNADGENGWDKNDPHGLYYSGTAASNTTTGDRATFTVTGSIVPGAYKGMQIRNDHAGAACYLHSAAILRNTATTITYYYYGSRDRGAPLLFNAGDEFSIRNVLIGLDQNGRGKGDLITSSKHQPRFWPNQQQETCFSWNNQNANTGQVLGFGNNSVPTQHEGSDYVNLGAGLPANQIPTQVTAAYPAGVNGGSAYTHEYTYPHPLVTGGPTPTPIPSSSPTATATATHTFHRAGRRDQ